MNKPGAIKPGLWAGHGERGAANGGSDMNEWIALALTPPVRRRATKVAALVGCILVAINHGDKALAGDLAAGDFVKMAMTFVVPYCVATYAAVSAMRESARRG